MQRIIFTVIVFLGFISGVNAQWKRVTTIPAPYDNAYYLEVFFLPSNPNYGWVCGKNGVVIRTTDAGANWDVAVIPFAYQLEGIYFANEKVGYTSGLVSGMAGNGGIFKTTDGGKTWSNVTPPGFVDLWGCYFWDANNGLVIGGGCDDQQQFYKTTDGGKNWSVFTLSFYNSGLSDLIIDKFTGIGYASGSGAIFKTTDYGATWDFFSKSGGNDWQEDLWINGNTILVPYSTDCTGDGGIGGARISTDFGATWKQTNLGASMFGAFLQSPERGWVVGWSRSCYYTSDAGKTWEDRNCGITPGANLDDIWFVNDSLGFVVGEGVYKYIGYDVSQPVIQANAQLPACSGDTVILSVNHSYDNYKWSTGETTPSIKVAKSGTYTVFASHNECDSATSAPFVVTFYPKSELTLQISDTTKLCVGDSAVINVKQNFKDYLWSTGEKTQSIYVTNSGTYSIVVTDSNGCVLKDSIKLSFAPNPKAEIDMQGHNNFCIGDTVVLSSRYDAITYKWFKDSDTNSFSENKSISITQSGKYRLFVLNEFGCWDISQPIDITVRLDSNALTFSVIDNQLYSLDSTTFPQIICKKIRITNISWKPQIIDNVVLLRNLSFSIPQSQLPITIAPGSYYDLEICYSPQNMGIERDTLVLNDICNPHILPLVAVGEQNNYNSNSKCDVPLEFSTQDIISLGKIYFGEPYPNPTTQVISVPISMFYQSDQRPNLNIYITNTLGNLIINPTYKIILQANQNNLVLEKSNAEFDLSNLPSGLYFLIFDGQEKIVKKIIKD